MLHYDYDLDRYIGNRKSNPGYGLGELDIPFISIDRKGIAGSETEQILDYRICVILVSVHNQLLSRQAILAPSSVCFTSALLT